MLLFGSVSRNSQDLTVALCCSDNLGDLKRSLVIFLGTGERAQEVNHFAMQV